MENRSDGKTQIDKVLECKTPQECMEFYNNWADTFDSDVEEEKYRGPQHLIEICSKYVKDKNAKILDVLCGTGVAVRLLAPLGYKHVDGIDASDKMLDHSRRLGLYENLYQEYLHPQISSAQLKKGCYDVLIAVGAFGPGHFTAAHLNHFYEPVKKGGLIIFGLRENWAEELNLTENLNRIENEGVWRLIERVKKADYLQKIPGVFYVFQRL